MLHLAHWTLDYWNMDYWTLVDWTLDYWNLDYWTIEPWTIEPWTNEKWVNAVLFGWNTALMQARSVTVSRLQITRLWSIQLCYGWLWHFISWIAYLYSLPQYEQQISDFARDRVNIHPRSWQRIRFVVHTSGKRLQRLQCNWSFRHKSYIVFHFEASVAIIIWRGFLKFAFTFTFCYNLNSLSL